MLKKSEKKSVSPVVVGAVSAAAGATVAAAVTAVLSDKKTQKKVKKTLVGVKKQALSKQHELLKKLPMGQKPVERHVTHKRTQPVKAD